MSLELTDWIDHHEGRKEFDKSHFYTLLMEQSADSISENEYERFFQFFTGKELLKQNLKSYFKKIDYREKISDLKSFLLMATKEDINEKKQLISDDELLEILNKEIIYVDDFSQVSKAQLGEWHAEFM